MWPLLINGILCDEEEKGKKLFNLKLKLSRLELEKTSYDELTIVILRKGDFSYVKESWAQCYKTSCPFFTNFRDKIDCRCQAFHA
jgi:hypothetical protein